MTTTEDIRHRVEQADSVRSARRSAAAQQIGELAQRRAALADQLADIERQLGDTLAAASDVIDVDELAQFTDIPAADLTRWLTSRRPTRGRRKRTITKDELPAPRGRRTAAELETPAPRISTSDQSAVQVP